MMRVGFLASARIDENVIGPQLECRIDPHITEQ